MVMFKNMKAIKIWGVIALLPFLGAIIYYGYPVISEEALYKKFSAQYIEKMQETKNQFFQIRDKFKEEERLPLYRVMISEELRKQCEFLLPYAKLGNLYARYFLSISCSELGLHSYSLFDVLEEISQRGGNFSFKRVPNSTEDVPFRGNALYQLGYAYKFSSNSWTTERVTPDIRKSKVYFKKACEEGYQYGCKSYQEIAEQEHKCSRELDKDACSYIRKFGKWGEN